MRKLYFSVWDNGKREFRYTIVRNDGMAWICGSTKDKRFDEAGPVFIGPLGPRKNNLGAQLSYKVWPPTIYNWVDAQETESVLTSE